MFTKSGHFIAVFGHWSARTRTGKVASATNRTYTSIEGAHSIGLHSIKPYQYNESKQQNNVDATVTIESCRSGSNQFLFVSDFLKINLAPSAATTSEMERGVQFDAHEVLSV